jgi:hypothetical protein
MAPVSTPILRPDLPQSGILWRSVHSDYFDTDTLGVWWHFLSRKAEASYSLGARSGWVRLVPDRGRTHLVQKETDHYYAAVTKVDLDATDSSAKAGIYLTNGNQQENVRLYTGFEGGKKIILRFDTAVRSMANPFGNVVWLKLERSLHSLSAYCSGDGSKWVSLGPPVSCVNLDKTQPHFNSWVGTSVGLFAEGKPADFDFFICKDVFSDIPAVSYRNYFGVEKLKADAGEAVTNTSDYGGWFMISGVDLGTDKDAATGIQVIASSSKAGAVEIWLDDLKDGKLIATAPIAATGENRWQAFREKIKNVSGHHDVFVKFPSGSQHLLYVKTIRFLR